MREMGIGPTWVRRETSATTCAQPEASADVDTDAAVAPATPSTPVAADSNAASDIIQAVIAPASKQPSAWDEPLVTETASIPAMVATAGTPAATANAVTDADIAEMDWDALQAAVATCVRCPLCKTRKRTVFGIGDRRARWLLVGEGPGRNEDQQGEPFVGPAGKLLDNMLIAIDLRRGENNYIANVVKCRPTDQHGSDRAPNAEEAAACRPYLDRQIALVQPATIVALGKVAAHSLLGSDPKTPLGSLRSTVHRHGSTPLIVTYHPAYLLRKPLDKAKSWQDLCLARQTAEGAPPPVA